MNLSEKIAFAYIKISELFGSLLQITVNFKYIFRITPSSSLVISKKKGEKLTKPRMMPTKTVVFRESL